jgi:hypothetical protein
LHMRLKGSGGPRNAKGCALPSPHTEGDYANFLANEVANRHEGICFVHGSSPSLAEDPVVQGNRIRDCGRLPRRTNNHAIRVSAARGTRIMDNWVYDNADRDIQLYPGADNTLVANSIIDRKGEGLILAGRAITS